MSNGSVVAGAAVAHRRRQILSTFRKLGATSPERAVPESSLDVRGHLIFKRMVKGGVIVRLPDGRYYLDEAAEARARRMRLTILAAVLTLFLIVIAWMVALGR